MNTNKTKTCICGREMVAAIFDYYCPDDNCPTNKKAVEERQAKEFERDLQYAIGRAEAHGVPTENLKRLTFEGGKFNEVQREAAEMLGRIRKLPRPDVSVHFPASKTPIQSGASDMFSVFSERTFSSLELRVLTELSLRMCGNCEGKRWEVTVTGRYVPCPQCNWTGLLGRHSTEVAARIHEALDKAKRQGVIVDRNYLLNLGIDPSDMVSDRGRSKSLSFTDGWYPFGGAKPMYTPEEQAEKNKLLEEMKDIVRAVGPLSIDPPSLPKTWAETHYTPVDGITHEVLPDYAAADAQFVMHVAKKRIEGGAEVAYFDIEGTHLNEAYVKRLGMFIHDQIEYEVDVHTLCAMEMFNIFRPEDVTEEQRRAAKTESFAKIYGRRQFVGSPMPYEPTEAEFERKKNALKNHVADIQQAAQRVQRRERYTRPTDADMYMSNAMKWPKTMRVVLDGWGEDEKKEDCRLIGVLSLNNVSTRDLGMVAVYDYVTVTPRSHRTSVQVTRPASGAHYRAQHKHSRYEDPEVKRIIRPHLRDIETCFAEDHLRVERGRRSVRNPNEAEIALYEKLMRQEQEELERRISAPTTVLVRDFDEECPCPNCEGSGALGKDTCKMCRGIGSVMRVSGKSIPQSKKNRRY
jgi:hypothetical protein